MSFPPGSPRGPRRWFLCPGRSAGREAAALAPRGQVRRVWRGARRAKSTRTPRAQRAAAGRHGCRTACGSKGAAAEAQFSGARGARERGKGRRRVSGAGSDSRALGGGGERVDVVVVAGQVGELVRAGALADGGNKGDVSLGGREAAGRATGRGAGAGGLRLEILRASSGALLARAPGRPRGPHSPDEVAPGDHELVELGKAGIRGRVEHDAHGHSRNFAGRVLLASRPKPACRATARRIRAPTLPQLGPDPGAKPAALSSRRGGPSRHRRAPWPRPPPSTRSGARATS